MRKFCLKAFLLALLIICSYSLMYLILPARISYISTTIAKHERLQETSSPKVVFVGGSNLAFGLDSELIEKGLGIRSVNMGLAAGLGLRLMLDEVKPALRPGDIVVIAPEYELFAGTVNGERDLAEMGLADLGNLQYFRTVEQYVVLFKNIPLFFQDKLTPYLSAPLHGRPITSEIYRRDGFNHYGDLTTHLGRSPHTDWQANFARDGINPNFDENSDSNVNGDALTILNEFHGYAQSKGVKVILTFPCVPDTLKVRDRRYIETLYRYLTTNSKLPIPDPPETFFYPLDCFFDSPYHLIAPCRERRTRQILDELRRI